MGRAEALIACGLVKQCWLPGNPGNGKTLQSLIFLEDGTAQLLKPKSRLALQDIGFGALHISKSGNIYHVVKFLEKGELERRKAASAKESEQETWQLAKQVHTQPDLTARWKNGVMHHIDQAERLIEGRLVFTDFPDIGIQSADVEAAKRAIAELRDILRWASPKIKDRVQRNNVVSLNDAAFRFMKPC